MELRTVMLIVTIIGALTNAQALLHNIAKWYPTRTSNITKNFFFNNIGIAVSVIWLLLTRQTEVQRPGVLLFFSFVSMGAKFLLCMQNYLATFHGQIFGDLDTAKMIVGVWVMGWAIVELFRYYQLRIVSLEDITWILCIPVLIIAILTVWLYYFTLKELVDIRASTFLIFLADVIFVMGCHILSMWGLLIDLSTNTILMMLSLTAYDAISFVLVMVSP